MRVKDERLQLRVKTEDKKVITERAKAKNLSISDYVLYTIMKEIVSEEESIIKK